MTQVFKGSTSNSLFFELVDSTTGLPKTGILSTDVTGSYSRSRGARVAITMATLASASAAFSSGGFILVDDTNQPGVYRLDLPDAAVVTGVFEVVVTLKATGCRTVSRQLDLVDINNQVAYAPNAVAGSTNGLFIAGTNAATTVTTAFTTTFTGSLTGSVASVSGAVGSIATGGITTASFFAGTTLPRVTLCDTTTTNTDMRGTDSAATAANLAIVAGYLDTEIAAIKAKTDTIPANPASTTNITAATGVVLSAAGVRAIWTDDHTGVAFASETAGWYLNDIHTDVNVLLTDWTNGGRLDLILDIIAADTTTDIPELIAAEAIKTAAIKVKTDNLPTDPADQSAVEAAITAATSPLATQVSVNTIDDLLDTEIAALTTQLGLVKDRVSYCLTVLVGACADAGTAAETYVYTIGGETFTADYTGLDATGNRSTTTLSKV